MTNAGMHVLLVNDDPFSLDTMGMILEMDGYVVTCARCKCKALEVLDRDDNQAPPIDLLVVDLEMSDRSGIELIEEMNRRKLAYPVLVVTEFTSKQTVVELMRQGVMDYMDKPIPMQEFRQRVDHMAESIVRRRARARLAAFRPEAPPAPGSLLPKSDSSRPLIHAGSAGTIDTADFGFPNSFRSRGPAAAGAAALACRKEYGCDILVAEVTGDGLESFYQTVLIKSCFDHHRSAGYDGQAFIRFLNQSLLKGSLGRGFANVLFARVFAAEKRMELIGAGNPFLTFLPAGGAQTRSFLGAAEPLGSTAEVSTEPRIFPIESGDRFFLYTRSLSKAALDESILAHRREPLETLVDKVWADIPSFGGTQGQSAMFFWGVEIP